MKNHYFNRPLYPETEYPNGYNDSEQQTNVNEQRSQQNGLNGLFSGLNQNGQNSLLSLLLGLKNGGGNINNILSSLGKSNPLFEVFSNFQNISKDNKKESQSSLKTVPQDEILF